MVTFKAMSYMHVFKDYIVIELGMKLVHELVGKEKGIEHRTHGGMLTRIHT